MRLSEFWGVGFRCSLSHIRSFYFRAGVRLATVPIVSVSGNNLNFLIILVWSLFSLSPSLSLLCHSVVVIKGLVTTDSY